MLLAPPLAPSAGEQVRSFVHSIWADLREITTDEFRLTSAASVIASALTNLRALLIIFRKKTQANRLTLQPSRPTVDS